MPSFSRLHMYLEVASSSAPITGEAADLDFLRQISLKSFSWRINRAGKDKDGTSSGSDRGRAVPETMEISKSMDKASTQMLSKLTAGTKLNAIITLAAHEESDFRFTARLSNIRIVDYQISGKDGDKSGEIDEDWTFNYDSIKLEYVPELQANERVAKPLSSNHMRSAQDSDKGSADGKSVLSAYKALTPSDQKSTATALKSEYDKQGYFK